VQNNIGIVGGSPEHRDSWRYPDQPETNIGDCTSKTSFPCILNRCYHARKHSTRARIVELRVGRALRRLHASSTSIVHKSLLLHVETMKTMSVAAFLTLHSSRDVSSSGDVRTVARARRQTVAALLAWYRIYYTSSTTSFLLAIWMFAQPFTTSQCLFWLAMDNIVAELSFLFMTLSLLW